MNNITSILWAVLLSISPISELRGGIPFAILSRVNPILTFLICVMANIIVIFFIFLFLDFLHVHFLRISIYKKVFDFFLRRVRKKAEKVEERLPIYGYFALTIFVAVPLPITGAWTGSLISWLLNLDRRKSILAIALGVVIAGIAVTLTSLGINHIF